MICLTTSGKTLHLTEHFLPFSLVLQLLSSSSWLTCVTVVVNLNFERIEDPLILSITLSAEVDPPHFRNCRDVCVNLEEFTNYQPWNHDILKQGGAFANIRDRLFSIMTHKAYSQGQATDWVLLIIRPEDRCLVDEKLNCATTLSQSAS